MLGKSLLSPTQAQCAERRLYRCGALATLRGSGGQPLTRTVADPVAAAALQNRLFEHLYAILALSQTGRPVKFEVSAWFFCRLLAEREDVYFPG